MKAWNSTFSAGAKPIKRSAFRATGKPMARTTAPAPKKQRARRARSFKTRIFRSAAYLALVRLMPCVCCGRDPAWTQAAHSNQLRFGKGKAIKGSDATAMPLCCSQGKGFVGCHERHDQGGKLAKAEWWEFEYAHICLTVIDLVKQHKLTGTPEVLALVRVIGEDYEAAAGFFVFLIESGQLKVAN